MPWVFDTSIAAAWCFEDERTPETELLHERLETDPATVPGIFPLEIANALTQAIRRKLPRTTPHNRALFLQNLSDAALSIDPHTNRYAWDKTIELADHYKLTTYDAAYLELALRLNLELATLDADLRAAATAAGVTVIP